MKNHIRKVKKVVEQEPKQKVKLRLINRNSNRLSRLPFEENLNAEKPSGKKFLKRLV